MRVFLTVRIPLYQMRRCNSASVSCVMFASSEGQHAHCRRPGQAAHERALQAVQWSGGRLRAAPRGEGHHLQRPAGILGHGLLPGERVSRARPSSNVACDKRQRVPLLFQVEDVNKKFNALREAEDRGWVEEHKPPPRQRKAVKVTPSSFLQFNLL